jgi:hypothetical protein
MGQVQAKKFPGYGVIYPDGVSGVRIVRTFTGGSSKMVNPDGSVRYTTPPPTIHELFGGGFAYADGSPVKFREHLEALPVEMREKAFKWFDESKELSPIATKDIPPLNLDEKERPEPTFILSSDLPAERDKVTEDLNKLVQNTELQSSLTSIAQAISSLSTIVKEQGQQIAQLQNQPGEVKSRKSHPDKRSEMMKARWADPEWRAKMKVKNGKNSTKTN